MTVKSREETRANREGTSRAGKGPLKHHEGNREGPGQKKREAQRASRAMRKHGRAVRTQERSWGEQGKIEAAEAAEQERTGKEPAGSGKGQGAARTGKDLGTTDWENRGGPGKNREEEGTNERGVRKLSYIVHQT